MEGAAGSRREEGSSTGTSSSRDSSSEESPAGQQRSVVMVMAEIQGMVAALQAAPAQRPRAQLRRSRNPRCLWKALPVWLTAFWWVAWGVGLAQEGLHPEFRVETVASGLEVPWALDFAPDGRIFLTERPGRIRIIQDGTLLPEPWMTLEVYRSGEAGLMGLALDPHFAENRFVYVAYTDPAGPTNVLVRLREDPATGKGVMDRVLWEGVPAARLHDGGRVRFGPDGKLYWTIGDAAQSASAQDPSTLNGTILRLNPDGTIPDDNPFPGSPVYSYGHRNPQGLAWHPRTGRLYATEHGPSGREGCCRDEVNLIQPGANYGWPVVTGDEQRTGMVAPLVHSGPRETWAPGGATFVTRGPWADSLVFVGLRGQALYRVILNPEGTQVVGLERWLAGEFGRLRDVVEGPDGSLYLLTSNRDGRAGGGFPTAADDRVLRLSWP